MKLCPKLYLIFIGTNWELPGEFDLFGLSWFQDAGAGVIKDLGDWRGTLPDRLTFYRNDLLVKSHVHDLCHDLDGLTWGYVLAFGGITNGYYTGVVRRWSGTTNSKIINIPSEVIHITIGLHAESDIEFFISKIIQFQANDTPTVRFVRGSLTFWGRVLPDNRILALFSSPNFHKCGIIIMGFDLQPVPEAQCGIHRCPKIHIMFQSDGIVIEIRIIPVQVGSPAGITAVRCWTKLTLWSSKLPAVLLARNRPFHLTRLHVISEERSLNDSINGHHIIVCILINAVAIYFPDRPGKDSVKSIFFW